MDEIKTRFLFSFDETIAKELLEETIYPWEALPKIGEFIKKIFENLDSSKYKEIGENIWAANNAKIAQTASITGPCFIDENAEIRHCAFIRGNAIIGKNAVVRKFNRIKKCNII